MSFIPCGNHVLCGFPSDPSYVMTMEATLKGTMKVDNTGNCHILMSGEIGDFSGTFHIPPKHWLVPWVTQIHPIKKVIWCHRFYTPSDPWPNPRVTRRVFEPGNRVFQDHWRHHLRSTEVSHLQRTKASVKRDPRPWPKMMWLAATPSIGGILAKMMEKIMVTLQFTKPMVFFETPSVLSL